MKKNLLWLLCGLVLLLSGSKYPDDQLAKNQIPNQARLENVLGAVDAYRKETKGLLPIKTKPQDTPIYEKYLIDFSSLKEKGLRSNTGQCI